MTDVLRRIYPDISLEVELKSHVEARNLDRDDMLELIGNLLDNACKFARARVRFTIDSIDNGLELAFEDDGRGLEPDQLRLLNRRGQRLDEQVAGHGLGLGICRDILDYYHGELAFGESDLGGLSVTARVPLNQ